MPRKKTSVTTEEGKTPPSNAVKRRRTYPKKAEPGTGIAGNPEKYQEAHAKVKENKYAPKEKIGTPTLGRSDSFVTKVGLGGLKTIHNGGIKY